MRKIIFLVLSLLMLIFFWITLLNFLHNKRISDFKELSIYGKYGVATIIKITNGKGYYASYSYKVGGITFYGKTWSNTKLVINDEFLLIYSKVNPRLHTIIFGKPILLSKDYNKYLGNTQIDTSLIDIQHISYDYWIFN